MSELTERERCKYCAFRTKLIMWERDKNGRYLPNYDNPLTCCTAIEGVVFGDTEPNDNGFCECFIDKEQEHE